MSKFDKWFKKNSKTNAYTLRDEYYAELWLDNAYYESGVATIHSDKVSLFGLFDLYVWGVDDDHGNISKAKKIGFRIPTVVTTYPNKIDKEKMKDGIVLEYVGGDDIITNLLVERDTTVARDFLKLILAGKLPDDIPYDKIMDYWLESNAINKVNLGVNILFQDLIVMVVSRDPGNTTRQFRELLRDKPTTSMKDRKLLNIDKITSIMNHFSAFIGADPKAGITATIGAENEGSLKNVSSDIEEVIE